MYSILIYYLKLGGIIEPDGLYIKKNVDLYITGSNAYLLSGELATLLSGRYIEIKMLPLSFKEYCSAFEEKNESKEEEEEMKEEANKIGYIYHDVESELYKWLTTTEGVKEYINPLLEKDAHGDEAQYYIVENNREVNQDALSYFKSVYTGVTRSEQGSILIARSDYITRTKNKNGESLLNLNKYNSNGVKFKSINQGDLDLIDDWCCLEYGVAYNGKGQYEAALDKLEKAAEYAIAFDAYKDGDSYTSLMLYGISADEHGLWDEKTTDDMLRRLTSQSRYECLKNNVRYENIIKKLSKRS